MLVTIIPAKPFRESKTRLASLLSPAQRAELSRYLLARTIAVAAELSQVLVVSRSEPVRQAAKWSGVRSLAEEGSELNTAISQGIGWAKAQGATHVLILPSDLPHLSTISLKELIARGLQAFPSMVIAPCRHNLGTNALFLSPPDLIAPQFGVGSFAAHQEAARAIDIPAHIYRAPDLAFDLDTPADWEALVSVEMLC